MFPSWEDLAGFLVRYLQAELGSSKEAQKARSLKKLAQARKVLTQDQAVGLGLWGVD